MYHSIDIVRQDLLTLPDYLTLRYPSKWLPNYAYEQRETVTYNGNQYICITSHTAGETFDATKFRRITKRYFWNTWEDWHLIPSSRPVFAAPKIKKRELEIPGMDGTLDLSDEDIGTVLFENSEDSFEFIVENDFEDWAVLYSTIMNAVHGRKVYMLLEDDPWYYRKGRLAVNNWASDPNYSRITFDYSVDPYKYVIVSSLEDWLWDPFDFETGVIREYIFEVSGTEPTTFDITGGRKPIRPKILYSGATNLTVQFSEIHEDILGNKTYLNTKSFNLSGTGELSPEELVIKDKDYLVTFKETASGSSFSGEIRFDYREGSL